MPNRVPHPTIVRSYEQSVAAEGLDMAKSGHEIVPEPVDLAQDYALVREEGPGRSTRACSSGHVWSVEFTGSGALQEGAGLQRIDHLAQTMSYDEMLSWSLFYTTLFEMRKSPMVDVVDPDGLVRSQALEAPGGAFRITLNGAETHRTMAGNFLANSFGASVQHIALTADDIFATSAALTSRGFDPLPMSNNYYADLAARFDLSTDLLDRLNAGNILYDEDARGAFFQFYSRPYAGGMFFEIVQRKDGYAGYGAPNAPFRIAAQKRLMRAKGIPTA